MGSSGVLASSAPCCLMAWRPGHRAAAALEQYLCGPTLHTPSSLVGVMSSSRLGDSQEPSSPFCDILLVA